MIGKKMLAGLNQQIQEEYYSAYLYLSMSAYLDRRGLSGMSHWMRIQYQEEEFHALKLYDYILERGGEVELLPIQKPQNDWTSVLKVFQDALAHEEYITGKINGLVDLAITEKDHASNNFLQWYVEEQVEEEDTANTNVHALTLIEDDSRGLLMLDREMSTRVFTPPVKE